MKKCIQKIENLEVLQEREDLFTEILEEGKILLKDSRRTNGGNLKYLLIEVIFVWLVGWIYGSQTYEKIAMDAAFKLTFLRKFLPFENGSPAKSTIARLVGLIDPECLEELLHIVVNKIQKAAEENIAKNDELKTIALDGKTNCGAQKTANDLNSLHIVGAFNTQLGIMLTQMVVPAKKNEITAIKNIVSYLKIAGYTITIDAMGTQKAITQLIRDRQANYIFSVKGNHKMVHLALIAFFSKEENLQKCDVYTAEFKGHGRKEMYECYVMNDALKALSWLKNRGWADLNSVIMVKHFEILEDGIIKVSVRYFITNLNETAKKIFYAIRSHWMIESSHWTLDVTFNEDNRIVWKRTVAKNESTLRRIVFNLLTVLRQSFKKSTSKNLPTYGAVQRKLFMDDVLMERLLLSVFK